MSLLHEAARKYAEAGWPIFIISPNGKEPLPGSSGFKDATTDPVVIDAWWRAYPDANIGFEPERANLCVIDVDSAKGGEWSDLRPDMRRVRTPSGGEHWYYEGSLPGTQSKVGKAVDTRGKGSYVLLPPSHVVYPDGAEGSYEWLDQWSPHMWDYAPVPGFVAELCKPKVKERRTAAAAAYSEDKPEAIRQANLYLDLKPAPVEHAGSDGACYEVAARLMDYGLSHGTILELMHDWSGFDHDWLQEKIDNAWRYRQNEEGCDTPASNQEAFGEAAARLVEVNDNSLFRTGKDRRLRDPKPVEELIPGLVEKGCVAYLAGPGGLNKSRIAFHWGASVHSGTPLYGKPVERAHFVHVSYENGADEDARRHHKLMQRLELNPAALDDYTACDWKGLGPLVAVDESASVAPTELWLALERKLHDIPDHKFIVFDSTYNVFAFLGHAKVNESAVQAAIDWLDTKMTELDATGLMLAHPSQAGIERGDGSGWSVAWINRPRVRITLKGEKDMPSSVILEVTKRNNAARRPPQTLHWIDGVMLPSTDSDEQLSIYRACVKVALAAANGGVPINNDRSKSVAVYCEAVRDECGIRPSAQELRRQLGIAAMRGDLCFRPYDKNRRGDTARAGYRPPVEPRFPPPDDGV